MNEINNFALSEMRAEARERAALTVADYVAAGVQAPNWENEPIPSLETWRRWQKAEDGALAHKRAQARPVKRDEPQNFSRLVVRADADCRNNCGQTATLWPVTTSLTD